jgi:NAD(P)H-dependent flavin oxidoreductase YrpB (nitropropane dioxygenase family)
LRAAASRTSEIVRTPRVRTVDTRFTLLVGCRLPFQLAVLGGVGTTDLAAAIAKGGGLGMVPFGVEPPPAELGTSGIGILMPYRPPEDAISKEAAKVRVVEFFEGDPDERLVDAGHAGSALVAWQVGSVDEGRAAEAAGCDFVVAQGMEAGGHVRGTMPLDELLSAMLGAVDVPVVAAGGIGTAKRVARLLAEGADAVRVGTRFLACPECNTHAAYVTALLAAEAQDTVLTGDFDDDGHWPAMVRVLGAALGPARRSGNRSTMPPTREADDPLSMACYAGMSVTDLTRIQPADEVLLDLVSRL